ncbi:MAG: PQQ-like beta-propeller repeat protein [Prolixibacteraceae bacterium]|nr:PQQ-like beta-propeller repeat protein [Prolixibacteraceae bacterium]
MRPIILFFFLFVYSLAICQSPNRWRGPYGNGFYDDVELQEQWSHNGPEIVWTIEGLGDGFSSPAFANAKIYLSGMIDSMGYIFVLSEEGTLLRKFPYGLEYTLRYVGSRSTPTVVGEYIYLQTGNGELVCMNETNGEAVWRKHITDDFGGQNLRFGIAESLVVDGNLVYASPGGPEHNIVALNRMTGEIIWSCPGEGTLAAYCTPLLFEHHERKVLTTMMTDCLLGVDATTGQLLWSYPYKKQRSNFPNTPIYHQGEIYYFSGYDNGGIKLKIANDASSVEMIWASDSLQSKMGGAVLLNGYLYGSGDTKRGWYCLDWNTGETVATYNGLANGVVITADQKLYLYTDRGEVVLMNPDPHNFKAISQTVLEMGTAQHWAHPVIHHKKLYVRHGNVLVVYAI